MDSGSDGGNTFFTVMRHFSYHGILANHNVFRNDTVFHDCSGFDHGSSHDNGIFYFCALCNLYTREQNRTFDMTCNTAAIGDHTVFHNGGFGDLMACFSAVSAVNLPIIVKQVDSAVFRLEDFHICLPQRGDGSYIFPVSAEMISVHIASVF